MRGSRREPGPEVDKPADGGPVERVTADGVRMAGPLTPPREEHHA